MTSANLLTNSIAIEQGLTRTENGALTNASTLDACLDLFGSLAACRDNVDRGWALFAKAYNENPELALRILFYTRDIRGGQGERNIFRVVMKQLVAQEPDVVISLIPLFSEYGRWDDLFSLEGTSAEAKAFERISSQLVEDLDSEKPSLLAKWMPSINASSQETKRLGRRFASAMGMTEKSYRQTLSQLRAKIRIVESAMCSGDWSDINYQSVPSQAMRRYRNAFQNRDGERFNQFLADVATGKATIKAGTLYPYELVEGLLGTGDDSALEVLDAQWKALPNYMEDEVFNGLVVADVSGSMHGRPLATAISLAMYISERNSCPTWKDQFITFSADPKLQTVTGDTLQERVLNLSRADWGMNTDFNKVFKLILDAAVRQNVAPQDMPTKLIVVSDMQFDQAASAQYGEPVEQTNFQQIRQMFRDAGYEAPHLVFWNAREAAGTPFTIHESGAHLVAGCSPSILKSVLNGNLITATDVMNDAVCSERYQPVGDALVDASYSKLCAPDPSVFPAPETFEGDEIAF